MTAGPCAADEPVELVDHSYDGVRLEAAELRENSALTGLTITRCDVAGLLAHGSRADRVTVSDSRLRGVTWTAGILRDVTLDTVTGSDVSFRFSTLRRVVLRDCRLPGLDLTEATLDAVLLERCDLRGARFDHARVKGLRIAGCDLAGATGAAGLAGASLQLDDLLSLAPSLAADLGLTVED